MNAHNSAPWYVLFSQSESGFILRAGQETIADTRESSKFYMSPENAKYIVDCVNAAPVLRTALDRLSHFAGRHCEKTNRMHTDETCSACNAATVLRKTQGVIL